MDNYIKEIVFIGLVLLFSIRWFLMEKNHTLKKYILFQGIFLITGPLAYIAGQSFDLPVLFVLILVALAGAIIFLVKAILLRRKLEKLNNHPTKHL